MCIFGSDFGSSARTYQSICEIPPDVMRVILPRGIMEREGPAYFLAVAYRWTAQATPPKSISF